uniref:hypothetical protein n=1 Tax=Streptococcus pneumoniae TaxID=1313 RepID=UPI000AA8F8B1
MIPRGDHNHYIKVQTKGYEAALKNKIPSLQSNYQPGTFYPNHSYLSQLDVTYKTPDLMSHFLPPHE